MKVFDRIQHWLLIGIIAIIPLFFAPLTAEFFVTAKAYLLVFGSLAVLILVALRIFVTGKMYTVKTAFSYILLTFLLVRGVSTYFASPNRVQALFSLPTGFMLFAGLTLMYFLITYIAGTQREKIPLFTAFSIGTFVAALTTIFFYFKPLAGVSMPQNWTFLQGQFSPMGNGLDSLLLLGFGLVLLIMFSMHSIKKGNHKAILTNLVGVGVVAIALLIIAVLMFQPKDPQSSLKLPPFSISWYSALETLKSPKSAVIGVGVDNFDALFTLAKPATYNATELWTLNFALARSTILHIWAESGLLGLIAILMLGIYAIREINGLRAHKDPQANLYTVAGVYVGLMVLFMPPSFMSLFISFVYLAALAQQGMEHEHQPVKEHDLHAHMPIYMGISLVILVGAIGASYYAGRLYAAEVYFKRSIDAIRTNNGQEVYQNLKRAVELQPRNERFRAQFAQINLLLANNIARRSQDGVKAGEKAAEISDKDRQAIAQFIQQAIAEGKALVALNPERAGNWNTLAVIYRNITNVAEGAQAWTIASYQEAIRRDANNPQLRLNLGGVYYSAQQYPQAIQHFQQAVALKPNWANAHYNLAWALYQNKQYVEASAVMKNVLQLIDKKSQDYKAAQENLALFDEKVDEATTSGAVKPVAPDAKAQPNEPLTLPATPEAVLSPALQLPENSGPAVSPAVTPKDSEASPTPTSTQ